MPPLLALTACIIFVLSLLRFERKQSPGVSRALWLPTIWMLYIASKPLAYWFSYKAVDPQQGSPLDRAFMIILICVALLVLIRRKFDWPGAIKANAPLFVLVAFMLVSISWSTMPFVSFKRWAQELLAILMAFTVLSESAPRQAIESVLRRTVYILIPFSVLLIKYFPEFGVQYGRWSGWRMWIGVTLQKNSLGRLCLISIFFLIWSLTKRRMEKRSPIWKYENHTEIFIMAVSIVLLLGPERDPFYSATSLYALCTGLVVYCGLLIARKWGVTVSSSIITVLAASIIIVGTAALFTGASEIGFAASTAGRDGTLTGRTGVWAALLPIAMKNPILGSGFGGFWTLRTREIFEISGAHSGYLEVLLALGFTGLMLVSLFYLSSCRRAHSLLSVDFYWSALWICLIIMHLAHNMAESSIDSMASQLSAIVLFLTVSSVNSASHG
jgi:exopolysaccharide production protein ExoQ